MTAFAVEFTARAERDLAKLPVDVQVRIVRALKGLAEAPRAAPNVKKLAGEEAYRLRVGEYRVLFKLLEGRLVVLVVRIGHRREIYWG